MHIAECSESFSLSNSYFIMTTFSFGVSSGVVLRLKQVVSCTT